MLHWYPPNNFPLWLRQYGRHSRNLQNVKPCIKKIIETGEYKISPTASFKIMDELIYRVVKLTPQDPISSLHAKQLSVAVTGVLPPRSRDFFWL